MLVVVCSRVQLFNFTSTSCTWYGLQFTYCCRRCNKHVSELISARRGWWRIS